MEASQVDLQPQPPPADAWLGLAPARPQGAGARGPLLDGRAAAAHHARARELRRAAADRRGAPARATAAARDARGRRGAAAAPRFEGKGARRRSDGIGGCICPPSCYKRPSAGTSGRWRFARRRRVTAQCFIRRLRSLTAPPADARAALPDARRRASRRSGCCGAAAGRRRRAAGGGASRSRAFFGVPFVPSHRVARDGAGPRRAAFLRWLRDTKRGRLAAAAQRWCGAC